MGLGGFDVQASAPRGVTGSFRVDVSLVGDVNGDHRVGFADLDLIRSHRGRPAGKTSGLIRFDLNHDGRIGPKDTRLARQNLGAETGVRPFFYLGDFLGLTLANGNAYAAWTDTRDGNQDIFTARILVSAPPVALNDRFEPNDMPATATDLGQVVRQQLPRLAVPAGDQDWFRVQAQATGDLTIAATTAAPGAQLAVGAQPN